MLLPFPSVAPSYQFKQGVPSEGRGYTRLRGLRKNWVKLWKKKNVYWERKFIVTLNAVRISFIILVTAETS